MFIMYAELCFKEKLNGYLSPTFKRDFPFVFVILAFEKKMCVFFFFSFNYLFLANSILFYFLFY